MTDQPGVSASNTQDDEIDLVQLLVTLWSGKLWIALFSAVALLIGVLVAVGTPPTYQADALLQLEERKGSLALPEGLDGLVGGNSPRGETERQILMSRMVLGQVVGMLNLDWSVTPHRAPLIGSILARYDLPVPEAGFLDTYERPGERLTLDLLQVPPRWIGQDMELSVTGPDSYRVTLPDDSVHDGETGETLGAPDAGFSLKVGRIGAPAGRMFTLAQTPEDKAIRTLRAALSVSEQGRETGILQVLYKSGDPRRAERVLDAVTQVYVRQNIARSAAEAEKSLDFIEKQLPAAETEMREAENALNDYRQEQQSVDLTFETENLLTQINRVETELRALEAREDEVSERYTSNHPVYQQLLTQKARLNEQLAKLRGEVGNLPETQREVLNLTRTLKLKQEIYTQLLTRAQEVRVLRASTVGNVRILDSARTAPSPVAPRRSMIALLSLILGGMFGIGFVLVRHWLRRGVQGSEELESAGLPVFATINFSQDADRKTRAGGKWPIVALTNPADITVEAMRSLRTSLHFGMLDADTRSLAITSPAPEAGKSFTSTNLAVVTAQAGQRVCLIDADLRRGELRKYFGLKKNTPGLAEYLAGEITLEQATYDTGVDGLSFIPTGRYPPNPSELLMRQSLTDLMAQLDAQFDLALLDCPPTLAVTDPVILGRAAGATIGIVRFDVTPLAEVEAMKRTLATSGIKLSGVILNGFDPRKAKAGYSYNYNYNYRYEYKART
ncbi:MAG: polysaccharide biosynthesis tyrosine autokinase [Sediminimonas qiaohouensis]|uniref:Polysaccharide biosynthesis tyrosine autokinase n=1 Tax=Sediminimonas qiaohouensis TaxID=552061 RepID=A0A7C9LM96_9RHOB|nr:polysaccharide biosynthesis tyrosine autokinase [Sediminimonas qiaohouensis]MTJ03840.1 polysaccharide biosynthesis tyrosine autokinase [Sediminimonas qiaohouensis]